MDHTGNTVSPRGFMANRGAEQHAHGMMSCVLGVGGVQGWQEARGIWVNRIGVVHDPDLQGNSVTQSIFFFECRHKGGDL